MNGAPLARERCNAEHYWVPEAACSNGTLCENGVCVVCVEGSMQCNDGKQRRCRNNGWVDDGLCACPAGKVWCESRKTCAPECGPSEYLNESLQCVQGHCGAGYTLSGCCQCCKNTPSGFECSAFNWNDVCLR